MKSNLLSQEEWDIYCIYGVSSCYIQLYTPSTSDFFRPRPAASDEKNPRSRGYIVAYSPRKTIYTLHISHLGGVYISFCPKLGAISYIFYIYAPSSGHFPHIFAHICPELGTISNSIVPNSGYMCFWPCYLNYPQPQS